MSDSGRTRRDALIEVVVAYRNWIGGAIAVGAIVVGVAMLLGWSPPSLSIPRPLKVAIVGLIVAVLIGWIPAAKIVSWLYNPPKRYIINLGLRESESPGIWRLSPSTWQDVEITEGEVYRWENTEHPTFEVESFDPESLEAVGTWRGSLPDRELLKREKQVEELRSELESEANRSIDLELSVSSRVRRAVKAIGQQIIDVHAETSIYSGEEIADVLDDVRRDVEQDAGDDLDGETLAAATAALEEIDSAAGAGAEAATDGGTER